MIREYNPATDMQHVLELSKRLTGFDFPDRIDVDFLSNVQRENLSADLEDSPMQSVIFVAEEDGIALGFVQLQVEKDWISRQRHAHLERLAVARAAEGKGIAKELMAYAEKWAKANNFPMITLNCFTTNKRAIGFYEHLGFEAETVKMAKQL